MSNSEGSHDLKSFEAKLAALVPRDDRLDRERLIFLAGQASVAPAAATGWRRHPIWPAAFATMSGIAATLLFLLVARPVVVPGGMREIATADRPRSTRAASSDVSSVLLADTLTARDALLGDLDQRITKLSSAKMLPGVSAESQEAPSLTPAAWRQVTDGIPSPAPSSGSSSPVITRKATI